MKDIRGNELTLEMAEALMARAKSRRRKDPTPKGYAAVPGTGPSGETCRSCRHMAPQRFAKTYNKCGLMQSYWTGGRGTDVLARSPACRRWEPKA